MSRRPTILVDMDGVLAHFDHAFLALCERMKWVIDCTLETQRHRFLADHMPHADQRQRARDAVDHTPNWFYDLPVIPGAVEGVNELAEHADVWLCTKPLERNHWCRDQKAKWVRKHLGLEWERRLIIAPDKSLIGGHILLDDAPKLHWLERAAWDPVIYSWPWNGEGSPWEPFPHFTWADGVERLLDLAATSRDLSGSL